LPRGVTVALQILDLFVMVRIHARQQCHFLQVRSASSKRRERFLLRDL